MKLGAAQRFALANESAVVDALEQRLHAIPEVRNAHPSSSAMGSDGNSSPVQF